MLAVVGGVSRVLAHVAAWLLFAIGAMLAYEVAARYFFNAPTIWAEELSRLFMIWAVFLASAALLSEDEHIRVTVLIERAPPFLQRLAKVVSLVFVAVISAFVAWHGLPIAAQSYEVGRSTGSMLDIPSWWSQAAIPLGFALIALEAVLLAVATLVTPDEAS